MDLLHFLVVMIILGYTQGVMLNVLFGPYLERASTFGKAQYYSFELNIAGSFGDALDQLRVMGGLVRPPSDPDSTSIPLLSPDLF